MENVFLVTAGKVHTICFVIAWESLNHTNRIMKAYSMHMNFSKKVLSLAFRFSLKLEKIYLSMKLALNVKCKKHTYFFFTFKEKYVDS